MIIVLYFRADWCGPCRTMGPIIDTLVEEYPDVIFKKIDVDTNEAMAINANVLSIPTCIIEKDGVETGRIVGATTKEKLRALLK